MNNVVLMGRLTRDPEIFVLKGDKTVASFSLAVNNTYNPEQADFFTCKAFGKTAEIIEKLVRKGTKICLDGRLHSYSYDKDDTTIYGVEIILNNFELCEKKQEEEQEKKPKKSYRR